MANTRPSFSEAESTEITSAETDASCRAPVTLLWTGATFWLLLGSVFALIASVKLHAPGLLADTAWLTYGRVEAACNSAQLYGFALQAAAGTALWLLCRMGKAKLFEGRFVSLAALLWNGAVCVGVAAILGGDSTGFEGFEMPASATAILLVCWAVMAGCGLASFARSKTKAFPSMWLIIGSLLWFGWILLTAWVLLLASPARGILQTSVAGWYANNLKQIVLGFAGLGSIFFLLPKLLGRPLYSLQLSAFAVWTLALFGSHAAVPINAPLPAWMASLSAAAALLTIIPLIAVALNIYLTARQDFKSLDKDISLRCSYAALIFWLIAGMQGVVTALPSVNSLLQFTLFTVAQSRLFLHGFVALAMFGAIYYAGPRLLQKPWPCPKLIHTHFWLFLAGTFVSYIALLVGGVGQGMLLSDPKIAFPVVMKTTAPALRVDTVGLLLVCIGQLAFATNLAVLAISAMRDSAARLKSRLLAPLEAGQ